ADQRSALSTLDGLAALIDHSLMRQRAGRDGAPRFEMLETIREYAAERLEAGGEADEARRRHTAYYLAVAEDAGAGLRSGRQSSTLRQLTDEQDNLRAALAGALARDDVATAARIAVALRHFWTMHGDVAEGRRWLAAILAHPTPLPPALRARVLGAA